MPEQTFNEWFDEAVIYAKTQNWPIEKECDSWSEYYNDDYTPEEAVNEDMMYST